MPRCYAPPKYERKPVGSAVDAFDDAIRQQLELVATMPATVIAERVGWTRGITVFKQRVAELRPAYLPPDPASRTSYVAGDIAQCDFWFPPIKLPVGFGQTRHPTQLPVLTMVTGYSRWLSAVLVPTRAAEDLFAGWWRLIHALGAVPRTLVWDGETAVGRNRGGRIELTAACQAFRGVLGAKVIVLKPRKPEHKGIVERAHDYLERSFYPAACSPGLRTSTAQLQDWLVKVNARVRRRLGCAPTDRIAADRQAMVALPPVAPATGWRAALRLPRDHYIRLDSNDYSVHPAVIGRRIEVVADLDRVRVFSQGKDAWWPTTSESGPGTRPSPIPTTSPPPTPCAAPTSARCDRCATPTQSCAVELRVEQRPLTDYDTALGIDLDSTADTRHADTGAPQYRR